MKTLNPTLDSNKGLSKTQLMINFTSFLFCILLLFPFRSITAQKRVNSFGVAFTSAITGSGHGTSYSPRLFFKSNRNLFSAGPVIQKRNFHLSGVQIGYEYTVFDGKASNRFGSDFENYSRKDGKVELFMFLSSSYLYSAYLGKSEIKMENGMSNDRIPVSIEHFKFKTIENYTGFGMRIKFTEQFKWYSAVGFGGYMTLDGPCDKHRNKQDISLLLKTGLSYQF
ncbi:MAG TPA: hypothetical protein VNX68_02525 [Nitrosopumilaceae archaeon]|nr:hypothetical protein [Nitrosopumilaceae archaeon]